MFKDIIHNDLSTFFNSDEFSDIHNIDGNDISVIVDDDRLQDRIKTEFEGVPIGNKLYFAKKEDYPGTPEIDSFQMFDNKPYTIGDVKEIDGVYEIIIRFGA